MPVLLQCDQMMESNVAHFFPKWPKPLLHTFLLKNDISLNSPKYYLFLSTFLSKFVIKTSQKQPKSVHTESVHDVYFQSKLIYLIALQSSILCVRDMFQQYFKLFCCLMQLSRLTMTKYLKRAVTFSFRMPLVRAKKLFESSTLVSSWLKFQLQVILYSISPHSKICKVYESHRLNYVI